MIEEIKNQLANYNDCMDSQYGISDEDYSRLEKMIYDSKSNFNETIHNLIVLRKKIGLENDWQSEQWWKNTSDFLTNYIDKTIGFLKTECLPEEFYLISEIFEDITEKSKSKDFVEAIEIIGLKYQVENDVFLIIEECKSLL